MSTTQRRIALGDTNTEAIRALRRRISHEVYRRLDTDEPAAHPTSWPLTRSLT